jgi:acyl-CoA synthetase (AMP-forming)/AMP-acid ligase II
MRDGPCELLNAAARHAKDFPTRAAVREIGSTQTRTLSYHELLEGTEALAKQLKARLAPGSVVMICSRNTCDFHVAFLAALAAGYAVFPMSSDAVEPELVRAAERARVAAVIGTVETVTMLREHVSLLIRIDRLADEPAAGMAHRPESTSLGSDLLLQTSGTTGHPGIVRRSGAAVDSVARNMVRAIGFSGFDQVFTTVPLCHSYGVEHGLLAPLLAGCTVNLSPSFNLASVVDVLRREKITIFPAVPSIFEMIGRLAPDDARFPSLRCAYSAGSLLPAPVSEMVHRRVGLRIGQVYGATEIGSVTFNDPHSRDFDPTSAGVPMEGVKIRPLTSSGVPALANTESQIHVSAPSMFSGYLHGDGSEIADGFFATGDIGRVTEKGELTLTGRLKLMIDVGGFKVNPTEVEQMFLEHPAVAECIVIPVPLTDTVNRLKALIIPRHAHQPPAVDELALFARARLTAYKVPRMFEIRHSLPRTATGKVLRHLIEV